MFHLTLKNMNRITFDFYKLINLDLNNVKDKVDKETLHLMQIEKNKKITFKSN